MMSRVDWLGTLSKRGLVMELVDFIEPSRGQVYW